MSTGIGEKADIAVVDHVSVQEEGLSVPVLEQELPP